MDFNDTPAEAKFRDEARSWLKANVPTAAELEGLDYIGKAKLWQKRKYDAGWACLRWPKEYGGRGASAMEAVIWGQEESKYETPQSIFTIGQGMAAPTLMAYASDEHKKRYLPKLASGEEIWCQLFSEPAGGSDLAALRTRSEKRGDEWVVNGQKIWTSGAHYSDWGILVTRSDPTVPKHKGLTYFFLNMKSPGIEIKPIKQISGGANFNEVYFTDVRIPDSQRLGAVGQGWQVSLTTLMNERATIGGGGMGVNFNVAYKLAQKVMIDDRPAIEDSAVRAKLANWYVEEAGLKYTGYRTMTALSRGQTPGPENSIGKLVAGTTLQEIATFALDLEGASGVLVDAAQPSASARFQAMLLRSPATRIEGGTDEILRNIIAERVLGLPADMRADRGMPFNQIPTRSR